MATHRHAVCVHTGGDVETGTPSSRARADAVAGGAAAAHTPGSVLASPEKEKAAQGHHLAPAVELTGIAAVPSAHSAAAAAASAAPTAGATSWLASSAPAAAAQGEHGAAALAAGTAAAAAAVALGAPSSPRHGGQASGGGASGGSSPATGVSRSSSMRHTSATIDVAAAAGIAAHHLPPSPLKGPSRSNSLTGSGTTPDAQQLAAGSAGSPFRGALPTRLSRSSSVGGGAGADSAVAVVGDPAVGAVARSSAARVGGGPGTGGAQSPGRGYESGSRSPVQGAAYTHLRRAGSGNGSPRASGGGGAAAGVSRQINLDGAAAAEVEAGGRHHLADDGGGGVGAGASKGGLRSPSPVHQVSRAVCHIPNSL